MDEIDINGYELLELIGYGSFSHVYKIRKKDTNNIYAAKISIKSSEENLAKSNTIIKESKIMSQFTHSTIIKNFGFNQNNFQNEPKPVIITEFFSNGSLKDVISLSKQSYIDSYWNDTRKLINIYGIASAMSLIHSKNIIHRDLKPSNILMDDFLLPKISDFGLSKINNQINNSSQEKLIGTPLYLAPEIWSKYEYTTACDVYAFSMILYEIITNERPFKSCGTSELATKVTTGIRPTFPSTTPSVYRLLIEKCWSQNPKDRPTFDQILIELRENREFIKGEVESDDYYAYIAYIESNTSLPIDEYLGKKTKTFSKIQISTEKVHLEPFKKSTHNDNLPSLETLRKSHDPVDIYRCGLHYMIGKEVPVNLPESCHFFREAADLGNADAMTKLGWMHENGYGVKKDLEEATRYYRMAAEVGQPDACFHLAWMLLQEDARESAGLFKAAAERGHVDAMHDYALMLQNGAGVARDEAEACRYYRMAAEHGQADSLNNYGLMLEGGVGVEKDVKEAARCYRLAAAKGQVNAMYNIAWMLEKGVGVERRDESEARRMYAMAARRGHVEAMFNLASMLVDGGEGDVREAARLFERAARRGHLDAMYNFALMLERGIGVEADTERAARVYGKAADKGHKKAREACERLKQPGSCTIQ